MKIHPLLHSLFTATILPTLLILPAGDGHSQSPYAGIYNGTFTGGEDGAFMVMTRHNGTSTILIYVFGGSHERKLSFPVNSNTGAFSFRTDKWGSLVSGTLNPAEGSYSSEFDGVGTGSGQLLPFTGPEKSSAGYYKGTFKGILGSGPIWAILAPDGNIFTAFDDPDSGGGARGVVMLDGSISWDFMTSGGLTIAAQLDRATNTLSGVANSAGNLASFSLKRSEEAPEEPIIISSQPQHQIALSGQSAMMSVEATGTDAALIQWQKNGKPIPGANRAELELPNLAFVDAGAYRCVIKSRWGTVTSSVAELTVVDGESRVVQVFTESPQKSKIITNARVAGKVSGYSWYRESTGPEGQLARTGFKVAGANTALLTITPNSSLLPEDGDTYTCRITAPGGSTTTSILVHISGTELPTFANAQLPSARVNFAYDVPLYSSGTPASMANVWKLKSGSALPSGLKLTPTGRLTGIPKVVAPGPVGTSFTIQAANQAGMEERLFSLIVEPQGASVAGVFSGLVTRSAIFNASMGGRFDLTIGTTGAMSGKLLLGGLSYPITGAMKSHDGSLVSDTIVKVSAAQRNPILWLNLSRSQEGATVSATMSNTEDFMMGSLLEVTGDLCPHSKKNPTPFLGRHHLSLEPDLHPAPGSPEGSGYAILTITDAGIVTWSGKLADETSITGSSLVTVRDTTFLHQMLYSGTGSFQGQTTLSTDEGGDNGMFDWLKLAQTKVTPSFMSGFYVEGANVQGGLYNKTVPILVQFGLDSHASSASIHFTHSLQNTSFSQAFTLASNAAISISPGNNPQGLKLKIDPATGLVTGEWMVPPGQTSSVSRKGKIFGIIAPGVGGASGFFIMPLTTASGAPLASGSFQIGPGF